MRKITGLLLAAVMVMGLAGCGGSGEETKAPEKETQKQEEAATAGGETKAADSETKAEEPAGAAGEKGVVYGSLSSWMPR